jgi:hypothetical protein
MLLNVHVLWRLGASSKVPPATPHDIAVTPQPNMNGGLVDIKKDVDIDPIQEQLAILNARLETMEHRFEMLSADDQPRLDASGENALIKKVVDSIHHPSNPLSSEGWFWSTRGKEEELSLSFSQTEGLAVNSVVCRSDWCRVEIEDTSGASGDLVSDLKLHLKINESLGRDTVIRSGERNGRHRVLFIQ